MRWKASRGLMMMRRDIIPLAIAGVVWVTIIVIAVATLSWIVGYSSQ